MLLLCFTPSSLLDCVLLNGCACLQDAVTICTLGIGTAFGESILDNTPRHATIVSRETSELLRIEQREFKSLWEVRRETSWTRSRFRGEGILIAELKVFNMELFCIEEPSDVIGAMHFLCCTYWTRSLREQPAEATEEEQGKAPRLPICHTGHLKTASVQTPPNPLLSIIL